jgi:hypothetical protein
MYRTCLFCNGHLGANEVVEAFPVGRRLAFDASRGRLWVVCFRCLRWNLTPLEERWEAIETCERLYRATRRRVSTGHIGLARVQERLELIRIGEPERPEFAAWRYGGVLRSRRRRWVAAGAATSLAALALASGWAWAMSAAGAGGMMLLVDVPSWALALVRRYSSVARVPAGAGGTGVVRGMHVKHAVILPLGPDGMLTLRVEHSAGSSLVSGDAATRVLGRVLAAVNRSGAGERDIHSAASEIERAQGPERFIERVSRLYGHRAGGAGIRTVDGALVSPAALGTWGIEDRLALEMALHESTERVAMEGELAALEAAWREAEEIATIADDLFLPAQVLSAMRRLRGEGSE